MKALGIIILHIIVISVLVWVGIALNDAISNEYAGLIAVFSIALGLYSTVLNILYQRWQNFYLFVNRMLLILRRTHTFWQPHFHFELGRDHDAHVIGEVWKHFQTGQYGSPIKKNQTSMTLEVSIDDLFIVSLRLGQNCLDLKFESRLLVPSHLYDEYRRRLSKLAEGMASILKPVSTKYSIITTFDGRNRNPYFGFFVSRVPAELLQTFQVAFRLTHDSDCRVEASIDCVNIEGANLTDTFEAVNQVLNLRALPQGGLK
jgi:hypothetical protein